MFAPFQYKYALQLHFGMSMCVNVGGTANPFCRFDENFLCMSNRPERTTLKNICT